jgi:hypothetical protein
VADYDAIEDAVKNHRPIPKDAIDLPESPDYRGDLLVEGYITYEINTDNTDKKNKNNKSEDK